MRPMAMAHDTVAAIRHFQILPHGDKGISFGDQHLSQHAAGAFTCKFAQWIVDGLTLTERKNSGISRHGVSLLSGGSGRLDTRLDTPPSINRRHPNSRLALLPAPAKRSRRSGLSGLPRSQLGYASIVSHCYFGKVRWAHIAVSFRQPMRQSASVPVWAIVGMAAAIAIVGLLTADRCALRL